MMHRASFFRRTAVLLAIAFPLVFSSLASAAGEPAKPATPAASGDYPGLNLGSLTDSDRSFFKRMMDKFPSTCGKPHSLAVSLRTDSGCRGSVVAAKWVLKLISDGFLESEVEEKYTDRYLRKKCYSIDASQAPVRGDPKAPVTIVEFSDFECPACRAAEPTIKQILQEYGKVRLLFMNYPLPMHANAMNATKAAVAAGKQGKFWSYHDKLFENQDKLTVADLERFATELKLDLTKFRVDMQAAKARVEKDQAEGKKAELAGTPGVYVNGCMAKASSVEELRSYVEAELAK